MIRYISKEIIEKNQNDLERLFKSEGLIFLDNYSLKIYKKFLNDSITTNRFLN